MKTCTGCKLDLEEEQFRLVMHRGKLYRKAECAECSRQRDREMYQRREAKVKPEKAKDPLNLLVNRWRGRVNRKEPLRWRA